MDGSRVLIAIDGKPLRWTFTPPLEIKKTLDLIRNSRLNTGN